MKKIIIGMLTLLLLCSCFFAVNAEEEPQVCYIMTDFEGFRSDDELWGNAPCKYGKIYAFQSETSTGTLVKRNGNQMVKCTLNGVANQYTHWMPWESHNLAAIFLLHPTGLRIHMITEDKPVIVTLRLDFGAPERILITNTACYAVNSDGTKTRSGVSVTLPANFDGYLYYPISDFSHSSEPNLTFEKMESLSNFVLFFTPYGGALNNTVVYVDNVELYNIGENTYVPTIDPVFSPTPIVAHTMDPSQTLPPVSEKTASPTATEPPVVTSEPTEAPTTVPTNAPTATSAPSATVAPTVNPGSSLLYIILGVLVIMAGSVFGFIMSRRKK